MPSLFFCVCVLLVVVVVVATKITQKRRARVGVCVVIFFLAQLLFFFLMRDALELFVFTQPGWMDGAGRPVWVAPPPLEKREKRKKNFFTVRRTKRLARARNEQIAYNLTLSGIITTWRRSCRCPTGDWSVRVFCFCSSTLLRFFLCACWSTNEERERERRRRRLFFSFCYEESLGWFLRSLSLSLSLSLSGRVKSRVRQRRRRSRIAFLRVRMSTTHTHNSSENLFLLFSTLRFEKKHNRAANRLVKRGHGHFPRQRPTNFKHQCVHGYCWYHTHDARSSRIR